MARVFAAQNLPADMNQVMDQLERHCLAPDGSLISKPAYYDLQLAREEMYKERQRYLESLAIYLEAIAMVEEYHQANSMANMGSIRDVQGLYLQLGLRNSPQVYETLEHRMVVAEAAQKLRLPLISKDGEIHEDEAEKWSIVSRSSLDSTSTSVTISPSTNSTNFTNLSNVGVGAANNSLSGGTTDALESEVGGVPNRFLGITPAYLWQTQLQQTPISMGIAEYQLLLAREVGSRLDAKCNKLADAVVIDDIDLAGHQNLTSRLPERVKLILEEIDREESAWREDLYSSDRKFAEYYYVLEQILGVLLKLVRDVKLQHQHKYDDLQKSWLCKRCETMSAKLRVLEHILLLETYTPETIPALHKIRKYLVESTEDASLAYNKAILNSQCHLAQQTTQNIFLLRYIQGVHIIILYIVVSLLISCSASFEFIVTLFLRKKVTRLREYQGVDPHFDTIARQYHEIVKKLENMQWTIHQVEIDLKRDHPIS